MGSHFKHYERQELCDKVYGLLAAQPDEWFTRSEIAKGVARTKNPIIVQMIEDLAAGGWFEKRQVPYKATHAYLYRVTAQPGACENLS